MREIERLLSRLREAKKVKKEAEDAIEQLKTAIWQIFDDEVEPQARDIFFDPADFSSEDEARIALEESNPGWELQSVDMENGLASFVQMRQYIKNQFYDKHGGVERRIAYPTPDIDLEQLKGLNPELYKEATVTERVVDWKKLDDYLQENPDAHYDLQKVLVPKKPRVSLHLVD